ncbi:hypothetical protein PG996_013894 [Apiospora saccharicola]|uniref:Uncharacterized protein n=1 Tax=Apiospora saccharicola TaxID=335842 RepID=A0ABR1TIR3_9PEZI
MREAYENIRFDLNSKKHPTWGFDIYRTSFKDDELWQRYLDYIQKAINCMAEGDGGRNVATCAALDVKETHTADGTSLDGLTQDEVRRCHREWVASLKANDPDVYRLMSEPRRNYFLLANEDALDKFRAAEKSEYRWSNHLDVGDGEPDWIPEGVLVVICEAEESNQRFSPEVYEEDNPEREMAWQYVEACSVIRLYEMLCETNYAWYGFFAWPQSRQVWDY